MLPAPPCAQDIPAQTLHNPCLCNAQQLLCSVQCLLDVLLISLSGNDIVLYCIVAWLFSKVRFFFTSARPLPQRLCFWTAFGRQYSFIAWCPTNLFGHTIEPTSSHSCHCPCMSLYLKVSYKQNCWRLLTEAPTMTLHNAAYSSL